MLKDIFNNPVAIERLRAGPAGPHLDDFVAWLVRQGYCPDTIRGYVPATVDFVTWARGVEVSEDSLDRTTLGNYRKHLRVTGRWQDGKSHNYYTGARRFVAFLGEVGVARELIVKEPTGVAEFRSWSCRHRGLKPSTVECYVRVINDLIAGLGADANRYDAASLRSFVLDKASHHSTSTAKNTVTAVRNYLRFLIASGKCATGLDDAVPRIAGWRLCTVPKYLEAEDVERIIDACDPSTAAGSRDTAVVILLARLALRAGDVAGLRLEDIQWDDARLVVSGKNRRESKLPLPQQVGDAILRYFECGRPAVDDNAIFLNTRAPYRSITSATVSQIARRAILRAGVRAPSFGSHVFRHSAATALLRRGVPLQEIGTVLRHKSLESVAYYAKVDIELLRSVARPWPGRPSC